MRPNLRLVLAAGVGVLYLVLIRACEPASQSEVTSHHDADHMMQRQANCFVPNLGQWEHGAKFVRRGGPMTVFVEDCGWLIDLQELPKERRLDEHNGIGPARGEKSKEIQTRWGVAVRMSFVGVGTDRHGTHRRGEATLSR